MKIIEKLTNKQLGKLLKQTYDGTKDDCSQCIAQKGCPLIGKNRFQCTKAVLEYVMKAEYIESNVEEDKLQNDLLLEQKEQM